MAHPFSANKCIGQSAIAWCFTPFILLYPIWFISEPQFIACIFRLSSTFPRCQLQAFQTIVSSAFAPISATINIFSPGQQFFSLVTTVSSHTIQHTDAQCRRLNIATTL
eukprot:scaffold567637_cov43-Prasinocladus_malaysianus.AAC.1